MPVTSFFKLFAINSKLLFNFAKKIGKLMRTRIAVILCFILEIFPVFAQEPGKLRVGLEAGGLLPVQEAGFGFLGAMELKYNLQNNMNIGLKTESTSFWKSDSYDAKILSFSFTYDYYFHSTGRRFSPFIGAGVGYYFCEAWDYSSIDLHCKFNSPTGFIRTGFEFWKIRTGLTYNWIRKQGVAFDSKNNDYLSLTVGFYLGGGKWK